MLLDRIDIPVYLDISNESNELKDHLLQGSEDTNLLVTLKRDGVALEVPDNSIVTLYCFYKIDEQTSGGCGTTDIDLTKNNYVLDPLDAGYNISIQNGQILIPVTEHITNSFGKNLMILKVDLSSSGTGQQVTSFSYNMVYYTDRNLAYTATSSADNLPHFDDLKRQVEDLTQESSINKQNISSNTVSIDHKADKDLTNVGEFSQADDGTILYKKDNMLKPAKIRIDDDNKLIITPYSFQTAPETIILGTNLAIHQNGGFIEYDTKTLNKNYLILSYENDPETGTSVPIYYQRGPKEVQQPWQDIDNTIMKNVTSIHLGYSTDDHQTQRNYMKLVNPITNFKFKLNINGHDVMDYPYGAWNDDTEPGYDLGANLQHIDLRPFWTTLKEYDITLYMKADQEIDLLGNGTIPYFAVDKNVITRRQVAMKDEIGTGPGTSDTAEEIRDKLKTLNGDERLPASSIKDIPIEETGSTIKGKLEALQDEARLSASAIKNLPQEKDAATIATELNALLGNDRVDYQALKNKPTEFSPNTEAITFSKRKEIIITMDNVGQFSIGDFLKITPKNDLNFEGTVITSSDDYKGELIGYVHEINDLNAKVVFFGARYTGVTGVSVGETAYIGIMPGGDSLEIRNSIEVFDKPYGICGTFGEDANNQYVAYFDAYRLISYYYGEKAQEDNVEIINTDSSVILPDFKNVILLNVDLSTITAVAIQQLPDLAKNSKLRIYVDAIGDYTKTLRLKPLAGQTVGGSTELNLKGGHKVILFADKDTNMWNVFSFADNLNLGIQVNDIADVRHIQFDGVTPTIDADNKVTINIPTDGTGGDTSNLAKKDLGNVTAEDFDNKLKASAAFKELASRIPSETPDTLKDKFLANYYEETAPIDITSLNGDFLSLHYQANSNTIIKQGLPDPSTGKILMVQYYKTDSFPDATLELIPGQYPVNGSLEPLVYDKTAFIGIFIPTNLGNYEFISENLLHDNYVGFKQQDGTYLETKYLDAMNGIEFLPNEDFDKAQAYILYPETGLVTSLRTDNAIVAQNQWSFLPFGLFTYESDVATFKEAPWSVNYGSESYNTNMRMNYGGLANFTIELQIEPHTFPTGEDDANIFVRLARLKENAEGIDIGDYEEVLGSEMLVNIQKNEAPFVHIFKEVTLPLVKDGVYCLQWKSDSSGNEVAYATGNDSTNLITIRMSFRKFLVDNTQKFKEYEWINQGFFGLHDGDDTHAVNTKVIFKPQFGKLEPLIGTGVIAVTLVPKGVCEKNTDTSKGIMGLQIVRPNEEIPLENVAGQPMAVAREYVKGEELKPLELIMAYNFDKPTAIEVRVGADLGVQEVVVTNESAMCIQPINKQTSYGLPMIAYQHYTNQNIKYRCAELGELNNVERLFGDYSKHVMEYGYAPSQPANYNYIIPGDKPYLMADNIWANPNSEQLMVYGTTNTFKMSNNVSNGSLQGTVNFFVDQKDLELIKGNRIKIYGHAEAKGIRFNIALCEFKGSGDITRKIVYDITGGQPDLETGWTIERNWVISPTQSYDTINYMLNVDPSTKALAIAVIPQTVNVADDIEQSITIRDLLISAEDQERNTISYFQIQSKMLDGEELLHYNIKGLISKFTLETSMPFTTNPLPISISNPTSQSNTVSLTMEDDGSGGKRFNLTNNHMYTFETKGLSFYNGHDTEVTMGFYYTLDGVKVDSTAVQEVIQPKQTKVFDLPIYDITAVSDNQKVQLVYTMPTISQPDSGAVYSKGGTIKALETDYQLDAIADKLRQIEITDNAYDTKTKMTLDNDPDGSNPTITAKS